MSRNILFISEQALKDSSQLSNNIDPKLLIPVVKAVQDKYILPMLGTALYNKLQDFIVAGPGTMPDGPYKILMDQYIKDAQVWYTLSDMPYHLRYRLINKGVVTREGEAIQTLSTTDIEKVMDYFKNNAQWYAERVILYLRANYALYPEYMLPGTTIDTVRPDFNQYAGGIFLGGANRHRRIDDCDDCNHWSMYGPDAGQPPR